MIKVRETSRGSALGAIDVYKSIAYNPDMTNYSKWLKSHVTTRGIEDLDWFKDKKKGDRREYYVSLEYSKVLCVLAKTENGKRLRKWLMDNK